MGIPMSELVHLKDGYYVHEDDWNSPCAWCSCSQSNNWYSGAVWLGSITGFFCSKSCLNRSKYDGYEPSISLYVKQNSSSGGCFITTAVCEILNLPDNCEELEILREFRDTFMTETEERQANVMEYYFIAPKIVEQISLRSNSVEIYKSILENSIQPAISAIKQGKKEVAYTIYSKMVTDLKEFLPETPTEETL